MAQDEVSRILTAIDELRKDFHLFKDTVNEKLAADFYEIKSIKQNCANQHQLKKQEPEPWVKKTLPYMQFITLAAVIVGILWGVSLWANKLAALVK